MTTHSFRLPASFAPLPASLFAVYDWCEPELYQLAEMDETAAEAYAEAAYANAVAHNEAGDFEAIDILRLWRWLRG